MSPTRPTVTNLGISPPVTVYHTWESRTFYVPPLARTVGNPAMLEVEVKYRLASTETVEARLREWGATVIADHAEADHYLNAPDRDFARTDEALRFRRIGDQTFLTYKGPRHDPKSKTRPELEVPCPPGAGP